MAQIDGAPVLPRPRDQTRRWRTRQDPSPRSGARSWRRCSPAPCRACEQRDTARRTAAAPSRTHSRPACCASLQRQGRAFSEQPRAREGGTQSSTRTSRWACRRLQISPASAGSGFTLGGKVPSTVTVLAHLSAATQYIKATYGEESTPRSRRRVQRHSGSSAGCRAAHRTDRLRSMPVPLRPGGQGRFRCGDACRRTAWRRPHDDAGVSHRWRGFEATRSRLKTRLDKALELRRAQRIPEQKAYNSSRRPPSPQNPQQHAEVAVELTHSYPYTAPHHGIQRHRGTVTQSGTIISAQRPLHRPSPRLRRLPRGGFCTSADEPALVCSVSAPRRCLAVAPAFASERNSPAQRVVDLSPPDRCADRRHRLPPFGCPRRAVPQLDLPPRLGGARSTTRSAQGLGCRGCCISPPCRAARRRSPFISRPCSTPAARPISKPRAPPWSSRLSPHPR